MHEVVTNYREKALLVGIITSNSGRSRIDEHLEELARLTDTAGAEVAGHAIQSKRTIDPALFIGRGKAEEIAKRVITDKIDLVIFDDDLSPVQARNLERLINVKILDRTGLILHIFSIRARSKEARTQVELAQLQYLLPRLTRQWTHLSKQYGGIGTKGPGETQIETDRRLIRARISRLKRNLEKISSQRTVQSKRRNSLNRVAIVGYTNAGKSTLMNMLTQSKIFVEDRLFATLDATVRSVKFNNSGKFLISDTVGFIRKLPPALIASFKSTLDEVRESDLLLHLVDVSTPGVEERIAVVNETLSSLASLNKPTVMVFNKVDLTDDRQEIFYLLKKYPNSCAISASRGINIDKLKREINSTFSA